MTKTAYPRTSTSRRISELKPWPRNSRRRKSVEDLKVSLAELGQFGSILVQAGTDRVIAGWHTTKAAAELGWETIECDEYEVPDDVARAWNVAANKLGERGDYDLDALAASLEGMSEIVAGALFTSDERDELLAGVQASAAAIPRVRPDLPKWDDYPPLRAVDGRERDEVPRERDNSVTPRDRTPEPAPGPVGVKTPEDDAADELELVLTLPAADHARALVLLEELGRDLGLFDDGAIILTALEELSAETLRQATTEGEIRTRREPTNEGLLTTEPTFSHE